MMNLLMTGTISPDDVDGYFDVLGKWGKYMADMYLHPIIFFSMIIILFCVYLARLIIFIRLDKEEAKSKGVWEKYRTYLLAHMITEYLIAFLFSYLSIKLSGAYLDSYIINCIVSEIVGWLLSIIVDYSIIIPIENKAGLFTNPMGKNLSIINSSKKKDSGTIGNQNNITINVGHSAIKEERPVINTEDTDEMEQTINIEETTEDMMKSLIDVQINQGKQIQLLSDNIDAIRETMMTTLRFDLKEKILECVKKGYATPDEYEKVTEKMANYTALHGNHGLQELYDNQFKNIVIK